jgi:hypothetical protein
MVRNEKVGNKSARSSKISICVVVTATVKKVVNQHPQFYEMLNKLSLGLIFLKVAGISSKWAKNDTVDHDEDHALLSKFKILDLKSLFELKKLLETKRMIVIIGFSERWMDWYLWYYFKKYAIPLIYIYPLSFVVSFQYRSPVSNILLSNFIRRLKRLGKRFINFYIRRHLIEVDTVYVSDRRNYEKMNRRPKYKEAVLINSSFYDSLLLKNYAVSNDYVVFLDSMPPYHTDQIRYGYSPINRALYYESLNRVLDWVGSLIGKEVVVCLHPKYNNEYLSRDFGERKAIKYRTDELVARAELVLFHETSSINSAIVYGKKIIQLTGSRFNDFVQKCCQAYQKLIQFKTIDMFEWREESARELITTLEVDWEKYNAYLADYIIASGQKRVPSCVQIVDHLSQKYKLPKSEEK